MGTESMAKQVFPEEHASWLSFLTFSWFSDFVKHVYTTTTSTDEFGQERSIGVDNLYAPGREFQATRIGKYFQRHWRQACQSLPPMKPSADGHPLDPDDMETAVKKHNPLLRALKSAYGWPFLLCGIIKILVDCGNFVSPFVFRLLMKEFEGKNVNLTQCFWYALLIFGIQMGTTLLFNLYFRLTAGIGLKARIALSEAIYRKVLRLSGRARGSLSQGYVVNLLSSDVTRVDSISGYMHYSWSGFFQIVLAMFFLSRADFLGSFSFIALACLALFVPIQIWITLQLGTFRRAAAPFTDDRIKAILEFVRGIRVVKMYAWESALMTRITQLRSSETDFVARSLRQRATFVTMSLAVPLIASLLTFGAFVWKRGSLGPSVFQSLVYFSLMRLPLTLLPMLGNMFVECRVALRRIEAFLTLEESETCSTDDDQDETTVDHKCKETLELTGRFQWETIRINTGSKKDREARRLASAAVSAANSVVPSRIASPNPTSSPISSPEDTQRRSPSPKHQRRHFQLLADLHIPAGTLVGIAGPTGSGKTSLLMAVLGEMPCLLDDPELPLDDDKPSNLVIARHNDFVRMKTAYCSQQAWLQHGTIRDNVCFGLPFDPEQYKDALHRSCFDVDVARFPAADDTLLGEAASNLSGGQKQRLAIARLLYSQPEVALYDDPLSALDSRVAKTLFNRAIRNGTGTRLLVTHNAYALQHCDIVLLMSEGHVVRSGPPSAVLPPFTADDVLEDDEKAPSKEEKVPLESPLNNANGKKETDSSSPARTAAYVEYASFAGGTSFLLAASLTALGLYGCGLAGEVWFALWREHEAAESSSLKGFFSQWGLVVFALLVVVQVGLSFMNGRVFARGSIQAAIRLHEEALTAVSRTPLDFFERNPSGRIVNRFSKDQDSVDNALGEALRAFCVQLANCAMALLCLVGASPLMLFAFVPIGMMFWRAQEMYRLCIRELKRIDAASRSPVFALVNETLAGLSTIRAFHREPHFLARQHAAFDVNNAALFSILTVNRWLAVRLEACTNSAMLGIVLLNVFVMPRIAAYIGNTLPGDGLSGAIVRLVNFLGSVSVLALAMKKSYDFSSILNWCIRQAAESEANIVGSERLAEYARKLEAEAPLVTSLHPPLAWPTAGAIDFDGLSLWYEVAEDDGRVEHVAKQNMRRKVALQDISLSIRPGERIGVVGRTGAGKSSLLAALFRLVDSYAGSIRIDGIDIRDIGLFELRSRISTIPQDPIVFTGTVRSNLDPFCRYTDDDLWMALERSHLRDLVEDLGGLDASVTGTGDDFSAGQRQLLCLARALVRNSKVLVLDEATANVDYDTDAKIQASIRRHFSSATIITIAHRIDTIIDYDRIVVMDSGRIVECDSPKTLLDRPDSQFSAYARSYQQQQHDKK